MGNGFLDRRDLRGDHLPRLPAEAIHLLFGNAFAGIVLSAAIFGAAHIYQGPKATVVIGVYGLMFGILAWKRGTVRPGMITHALHDTFSGLAVKLLPK